MRRRRRARAFDLRKALRASGQRGNPDPRCPCGCGLPLPPEARSKPGRDVVWATPACRVRAAKARKLGWGTAESLSAAAWLLGARPGGAEEPEAPDVAPVPFANPRICSCGCGKVARWASAECLVRGLPEEVLPLAPEEEDD